MLPSVVHCNVIGPYRRARYILQMPFGPAANRMNPAQVPIHVD